MLVFYNFFLISFKISIRIASLWNPKAKNWVSGRHNIIGRMREARKNFEGPLVWFHAASLGEFEQGRSLIEKIKKQYPGHVVLLTFFSPSGYEVRKDYKNSDMIFYLPLDGKKAATEFLDIFKPKLAIFIKYDSWYYYLSELNKRNVPTILISAHFTPNLVYFGIFGSFFRQMLEKYSHIFVQNNDSIELLKKFGMKVPISISGDTRYDRVFDVIHAPFRNEAIEKFCQSGTILVAGSTWTEDEILLEHLHKQLPELKIVIAPHDINLQAIEKIKKRFRNSSLLSEFDQSKTDSKVLIVDSIGMLAGIYRYSNICYVGGGFNPSGIHNILEPAAYGRVVFFGKEYWYSVEAKQLISLGVAFSVKTKEELADLFIPLIHDKPALDQKNEVAANFVKYNLGATEKIMDYIKVNKLI